MQFEFRLNRVQKYTFNFVYSDLHTLKNGPMPASFSFIFGLFKQQIHFLQQNQCEKMSNAFQYMVPGFEPTNSQT